MSSLEQTCAQGFAMMYPQPEQRQVRRAIRLPPSRQITVEIRERHTMQPARYDILRRQDTTAIWLENSADLNAAKSRIKKIVSFWPGRYEVIDLQSKRIVAAVATPSRLRGSFSRVRESAGKSFLTGYAWLLAPAPRVPDLISYKRLHTYARNCYRTSWGWLSSPAGRV
jgi:hypothetical protein